jgi:hypothetical protein
MYHFNFFFLSGDDRSGIDHGVLVQMLTIFIASCPREVTGVPELEPKILRTFKEAWDTDCIEVWNQEVVGSIPAHDTYCRFKCCMSGL